MDYQELFHRERATSQELREALREQDEQIKSMHFKMTRLAEQVQKAMASKKSGAGGRDIQVEGFIEQLNAENRAMREKIHDLENRLVATMGQKKGKAAKRAPSRGRRPLSDQEDDGSEFDISEFEDASVFDLLH